MLVQCACGCGQWFEPTDDQRRRLRRGATQSAYAPGHRRRGTRPHAQRWRVDHQGYLQRYAPWHPNATTNGEVPEHRFLMAALLGRPLREGEIVHHRNGDKLDNRLSNIQLTGRGYHSVVHADDRRKPPLPLKTCPTCGRRFRNPNRSAHKKVRYCSRRCYYGRNPPPAPKRCPACGKWFLTPRRQNHEKARCCSRECAAAYRTMHN